MAYFVNGISQKNMSKSMKVTKRIAASTVAIATEAKELVTLLAQTRKLTAGKSFKTPEEHEYCHACMAKEDEILRKIYSFALAHQHDNLEC